MRQSRQALALADGVKTVYHVVVGCAASLVCLGVLLLVGVLLSFQSTEAVALASATILEFLLVFRLRGRSVASIKDFLGHYCFVGSIDYLLCIHTVELVIALGCWYLGGSRTLLEFGKTTHLHPLLHGFKVLVVGLVHLRLVFSSITIRNIAFTRRLRYLFL